jgi:uncharacterized radical SAM protein YgiQ
MGEHVILSVARRLKAGENIRNLTQLPQTAYLTEVLPEENKRYLMLHPFESCVQNKHQFAENFRTIETESDKQHAHGLIEPVAGKYVVANPPESLLDESRMDFAFDLPYTRLPHPRYKDKHIPAFEMIKFSVNIHRGCFGGCSFCTISAHQGKFITCRSDNSILREVQQIVRMPDFKGHLSDLGGPSANMFGMKGNNSAMCERCSRYSCIHPRICPNLSTNHSRLLALYRAVRNTKGIKKVSIGSGIRYDLLLNDKGFITPTHAEYFKELLIHHVSGRLKVAPEHTSPRVLRAMRKPSFGLFVRLNDEFRRMSTSCSLNQQLIPYFISGHPACEEADMRQLSDTMRRLKLNHPEQVQDFTPTPMTLSSVMFYCGFDPYSGEKLYVARERTEKQQQKQYFFR